METRTCEKCGVDKPLDRDHFYTFKKPAATNPHSDATSYYRRRCKECSRTKTRAYYQAVTGPMLSSLRQNPGQDASGISHITLKTLACELEIECDTLRSWAKYHKIPCFYVKDRVNPKAVWAAYTLEVADEIRRMRGALVPQHAAIKPGSQFGRWTVTGPCTSYLRGPSRIWLAPCRCSCGNESNVHIYTLLDGMSTSCGCFSRELTSAMMLTHGASSGGKVSPLYSLWSSMRQRCMNPNNKGYEYYGGRGITVCPEWAVFPPFREWALANGYRKGLSIDRIDNDLSYSPENCRWTGIVEQMNNMSSNLRIEAWGEEKTLAEWSRDWRCAVHYGTLQARLQKLFWEPERAISTPPMVRGW